MENEQNNYMAKAISAAIEKGGYKPKNESPKTHDVLYGVLKYRATEQYSVLDHEFWKSLGRALGWEKTVIDGRQWNSGYGDYHDAWLGHAMEYFEQVMLGNDTEKFWSNLISK